MYRSLPLSRSRSRTLSRPFCPSSSRSFRQLPRRTGSRSRGSAGRTSRGYRFQRAGSAICSLSRFSTLRVSGFPPSSVQACGFRVSILFVSASCRPCSPFGRTWARHRDESCGSRTACRRSADCGLRGWTRVRSRALGDSPLKARTARASERAALAAFDRIARDASDRAGLTDFLETSARVAADFLFSDRVFSCCSASASADASASMPTTSAVVHRRVPMTTS